MEKERDIVTNLTTPETKKKENKSRPFWQIRPQELAKLLKGKVVCEDGFITTITDHEGGRILIEYPQTAREEASGHLMTKNKDICEFNLETAFLKKEKNGISFVSLGNFALLECFYGGLLLDYSAVGKVDVG